MLSLIPEVVNAAVYTIRYIYLIDAFLPCLRLQGTHAEGTSFDVDVDRPPALLEEIDRSVGIFDDLRKRSMEKTKESSYCGLHGAHTKYKIGPGITHRLASKLSDSGTTGPRTAANDWCTIAIALLHVACELEHKRLIFKLLSNSVSPIATL